MRFSKSLTVQSKLCGLNILIIKATLAGPHCWGYWIGKIERRGQGEKRRIAEEALGDWLSLSKYTVMKSDNGALFSRSLVSPLSVAIKVFSH
jgi:hypothetical protein